MIPKRQKYKAGVYIGKDEGITGKLKNLLVLKNVKVQVL